MVGAGWDIFLCHPIQTKYKIQIAVYLIGTRRFSVYGKMY